MAALQSHSKEGVVWPTLPPSRQRPARRRSLGREGPKAVTRFKPSANPLCLGRVPVPALAFPTEGMELPPPTPLSRDGTLKVRQPDCGTSAKRRCVRCTLATLPLMPLALSGDGKLVPLQPACPGLRPGCANPPPRNPCHPEAPKWKPIGTLGNIRTTPPGIQSSNSFIELYGTLFSNHSMEPPAPPGNVRNLFEQSLHTTLEKPSGNFQHPPEPYSGPLRSLPGQRPHSFQPFKIRRLVGPAEDPTPDDLPSRHPHHRL